MKLPLSTTRSTNCKIIMTGFSLSGGGGNRGGDEQIPAESLFLYGASNTQSGSATTRGFELWQQHQIQRQQHQFYSSAPTMIGFSSDEAGGGSIRRGSCSTSGGMSCQDCGNQAKKDCSHMRCRTCCKSRDFQCSTHVKSTWVSASKRRERQQQLPPGATVAGGSARSGGSSGSGEGSKRPRELSTHNKNPTAITAATSEGMEVGNFPTVVSTPAVFRCVRVSMMDETEEEYAYQTAVNIGGHVFRGVLYDQGPESQHDSSSTATADAITATTSAPHSLTVGTTSVAVAGSPGLLDPSSMYPTPLSAFIAGTQFFPHHPRH